MFSLEKAPDQAYQQFGEWTPYFIDLEKAKGQVKKTPAVTQKENYNLELASEKYYKPRFFTFPDA
jgi:hypothetical protein